MRNVRPTADIVQLGRFRQMVAEVGGQVEQGLDEATLALSRINSAARLGPYRIGDAFGIIQHSFAADALRAIVLARLKGLNPKAFVAALDVANELARLVRLVGNLVYKVARLGKSSLPSGPMRGIRNMALIVLAQLRDVLDNLGVREAACCLAIRRREGEVDDLYASILQEILCVATAEPRQAALCIDLLLCAKNVERIGDHVSAMASAVIVMNDMPFAQQTLAAE